MTDEYLPAHVYANWLTLAARVVLEPYAPDPDDLAAGLTACPADVDQDRAAWQQWAIDRLAVNLHDTPPAPHAPTRGRRIGYMADAEPDRSGARVYTSAGARGAELFGRQLAGRRRPQPEGRRRPQADEL